ncbi:dienelactone hydrolase family protein [Salinarimonas sp. NSM]|uniref:dienelactone hydrolase family protein n=1 Tax=Salinarimonas sp. NSM TaxID=3458003 RepID=UPI004034F8DF
MTATRWETILEAEGRAMRAYVSLPPSGRGPALVLGAEIFGINLHIREVADQWAAEGFVVVAPDLFWRLEPGVELGYDGEDLEHARTLYRALDLDQAVRDAAATLDHAGRMPECAGPVGFLGFCFGGKLSFRVAAAADPAFSIGYYGVGLETMLDEVGDVRCPYMMNYGGADKSTPPEAVEAVRRAMQGRDDAVINVWEGAGHGFNNWRKANAFHGPASQRAFARSLAFAKAALA